MRSGIASLLPDDYEAQIRNIWEDFEDTFGKPDKDHQYPHFSYQVADHYDEDALDTALTTFANNHTALTVRTTGLGIFTGETLVLYVAIVRDPVLSHFHHDLCETLAPHCHDPIAHYHPDSWVPHITLAEGNIALDDIPQATEMLQERDFQWTMTINTLALLTLNPQNNHTISHQVTLTAPDESDDDASESA